MYIKLKKNQCLFFLQVRGMRLSKGREYSSTEQRSINLHQGKVVEKKDQLNEDKVGLSHSRSHPCNGNDQGQ